MVSIRTIAALLLITARITPTGAFTVTPRKHQGVDIGVMRCIIRVNARTVGNEEESKEEFWAEQKQLAAAIAAQADKQELTLKRAQKEKFARRRLALVSDTLFFSSLVFSALWLLSPSPLTPFSYLFGALLGAAYSYGLGKYVESIGGTVEQDLGGGGLGQARFAFLILLFVVVGKFRSQGLQEIPAIGGFFTYQIASLGQGLRDYDD